VPAPRRAVQPSPTAHGRVVDYSAFNDDPSEPDVTASVRGRAADDDEAGSSLGAGGAPLSLRRGMRVFHRRFGNGIVEACEGADKVVARFKGFGPKKVMLEYLTLQK
jgi:hypothetical protein